MALMMKTTDRSDVKTSATRQGKSWHTDVVWKLVTVRKAMLSKTVKKYALPRKTIDFEENLLERTHAMRK